MRFRQTKLKLTIKVKLHSLLSSSYNRHKTERKMNKETESKQERACYWQKCNTIKILLEKTKIILLQYSHTYLGILAQVSDAHAMAFSFPHQATALWKQHKKRKGEKIFYIISNFFLLVTISSKPNKLKHNEIWRNDKTSSNQVDLNRSKFFCFLFYFIFKVSLNNAKKKLNH